MRLQWESPAKISSKSEREKERERHRERERQTDKKRDIHWTRLFEINRVSVCVCEGDL